MNIQGSLERLRGSCELRLRLSGAGEQRTNAPGFPAGQKGARSHPLADPHPPGVAPSRLCAPWGFGKDWEGGWERSLGLEHLGIRSPAGGVGGTWKCLRAPVPQALRSVPPVSLGGRGISTGLPRAVCPWIPWNNLGCGHVLVLSQVMGWRLVLVGFSL